MPKNHHLLQTLQFQKARIYLVNQLHREVDFSVSNPLPQVVSLAIKISLQKVNPCSEAKHRTLSRLAGINLLEVDFLDLQLRLRDHHFLVETKMEPRMAEVSLVTVMLQQEAECLATLFHQQALEQQRSSANRRASSQTPKIRSSTRTLSQRLVSKIMLIQVTMREPAMVETVHQHLWMLHRSITRTLSPKNMNK